MTSENRPLSILRILSVELNSFVKRATKNDDRHDYR